MFMFDNEHKATNQWGDDTHNACCDEEAALTAHHDAWIDGVFQSWHT